MISMPPDESPPSPDQHAEHVRGLSEAIYSWSIQRGSTKIHEANAAWLQRFPREKLWQSRVYHRAIGSTLPEESELRDTPEIDAMIITDLEAIVAEIARTSATVFSPPEGESAER
jgi:hypothetical protein